MNAAICPSCSGTWEWDTGSPSTEPASACPCQPYVAYNGAKPCPGLSNVFGGPAGSTYSGEEAPFASFPATYGVLQQDCTGGATPQLLFSVGSVLDGSGDTLSVSLMDYPAPESVYTVTEYTTYNPAFGGTVTVYLLTFTFFYPTAYTPADIILNYGATTGMGPIAAGTGGKLAVAPTGVISGSYTQYAASAYIIFGCPCCIAEFEDASAGAFTEP